MQGEAKHIKASSHLRNWLDLSFPFIKVCPVQYIKVCRVDDIPENGGRCVYIDKKSVALFKSKGNVYALENKCSHAGRPLDGGDIEDLQVECPFHKWKFDLETGRCTYGGGKFVKSYPVKVEDGNVHISLS
mmetsp:Transcript_23799/g.40953  ORF Transcript_23799/g.40953 Transcript_23799/m.40953 type:complete len:131 (+) Transcript_23799:153-545(+)